jgi:hypothetical protein
MKSKVWFAVLVISLAMNVGIATMLGLKFFQKSRVDIAKGCTFVANDNPLYLQLGLSPEQLAIVHPMALEFHEKIGNLSKKIHENRSTMISMIEKEPVEMEQVNLVRKEMATMQSTIQQDVFDHIMKMKQILTPAQREVFFQSLRQSFIAQNFNCNK